MAAITGLDCKLYRMTTGSRATWGTADSDGFNSGAAHANLSEITNVRDVQMPMDVEAADVTTRAANGWKMELPTLKNGAVTFETVYDTADTHFVALLAAWISKSTVAIAVLFGDKATVGTRGFWADFKVFKAESNQPLTDGVKVSFELRPTYSSVAPQWVKVTA